jgi:hypothetical protein
MSEKDTAFWLEGRTSPSNLLYIIVATNNQINKQITHLKLLEQYTVNVLPTKKLISTRDNSMLNGLI